MDAGNMLKSSSRAGELRLHRRDHARRAPRKHHREEFFSPGLERRIPGPVRVDRPQVEDTNFHHWRGLRERLLEVTMGVRILGQTPS